MSKIKYCILCGDDVEEKDHKVCVWHAICEKDKNGNPLYDIECEYALIKYNSKEIYMDYVTNKKNKILNILNIK